MWPIERERDCWQWILVRLWLTGSCALFSCALLASAARAQSEPSSFRSISDVRPRIPDEHDRPYFRETESHRGFEVREPQFTIVAETSRADAQAAAMHVRAAWQHASKLADRFATVHQQADFGLNALQVVITAEPARERDAPPTSINVVGIQTQVLVNVGPGQPSLERQIVRLREGAAFAMFHAVGLDAVSPPWVAAGMAAVAGHTGLSAETLAQAPDASRIARFGGQQWRFSREAQDVLAYPQIDHEHAASAVAFLLTGEDARHAPQFFSALREARRLAQEAAATGAAFEALPSNERPASSSTVFDRMIAERDASFAAWKSNPNMGVPVFEPAADLSPDVAEAQGDMLVLLKLERRLSSGLDIERSSGKGPKVVTFSREQGAIVQRLSTARPGWTSFSAFAAAVLDTSAGEWATIDRDGTVLVATDRDRVEQLLSPRGRRYLVERQNGSTRLVLQMNDGQTVRGWLEDNSDDKTRPIARFEVRAPAKRIKTLSSPNSLSTAPQSIR